MNGVPHLPGWDQLSDFRFNAKLTENPVPAGVSTGRMTVGIAVTATEALTMVRNGRPVPLTITDIYAPIGR